MKIAKINFFIQELLSRFQNIVIRLKYCPEDDFYVIYHNYQDYENDQSFSDFVANLIVSCFWSNEIYDVCFSYADNLKKFENVSSYIAGFDINVTVGKSSLRKVYGMSSAPEHFVPKLTLEFSNSLLHDERNDYFMPNYYDIKCDNFIRVLAEVA